MYSMHSLFYVDCFIVTATVYLYLEHRENDKERESGLKNRSWNSLSFSIPVSPLQTSSCISLCVYVQHVKMCVVSIRVWAARSLRREGHCVLFPYRPCICKRHRETESEREHSRGFIWLTRMQYSRYWKHFLCVQVKILSHRFYIILLNPDDIEWYFNGGDHNPQLSEMIYYIITAITCRKSTTGGIPSSVTLNNKRQPKSN